MCVLSMHQCVCVLTFIKCVVKSKILVLLAKWGHFLLGPKILKDSELGSGSG